MAKRRAKVDAATAPPDADLYYIPEQFRQFAVRIDSLVLDPHNVKDHGDGDLDAHQASLREFGIRRFVVVRTADRQVEAGNGTCMAAQRNGWEYVPVLFCDDDEGRAKAFAFADNAIATLAKWNEDEVAKLTKDALQFAGELDLDSLVNSVLADLGVEPDETQEAAGGTLPPDGAASVPVGDVMVQRRVVVTCRSEDEQLKLIARLQGEGYECDISSRLAK